METILGTESMKKFIALVFILALSVGAVFSGPGIARADDSFTVTPSSNFFFLFLISGRASTFPAVSGS